ncbi:MAG: VCBS repeat-containing protein [Actinobacteria bacterium]|nr:VCBS repeat-containing protein [Actinomycetota bacterium]
MSHRARAAGGVIAVLASVISILVAAPLGSPAAAGVSVTPAWERTFGELNYHSSPTIADVDGDGTNDVAVASQSGWIRIFKADGSDLGGWPQRASLGGTNAGVDSSPTIADLDNDGRNEVIVGVGALRDPGSNGGLLVFNRDGTLRWAFQTQDRQEGSNGRSDAVFSTPAVGDVNGDGAPEIVFGSYDHHIYVLDRNGANLPGSPYYNEDTVWSSPALYDFDFDGRNEIFVGGDSSAGGTIDHAGGIMHMLEYQRGSIVERWRRYAGEIIISSPAVGNIDGDAKPEVVFGPGDFFKHDDSRRVFTSTPRLAPTPPAGPSPQAVMAGARPPSAT